MLQRMRLVGTVIAALAVAAAGSLAPAGDATRDYSAVAARSSPAWVHDGVIYEIFPRNFSATGNFAGITAQLDRLQKLGVTILWLMPIHTIGARERKGSVGSPYAVRDYYAINPAYGKAADLRTLVREAHRRGLKVIIDIVANHTAWDSVLMRTPRFYTHDASGRIIPPVPDWADVADLSYDNPALRRYMIDMLAHWLRDFDLDGFRCDVAGFVPTDFWEQVRSELSAIKPDILMLAEAEEPALIARAFDVDYSWSLHATLTEVLQGRKPASALRDSWLESSKRYPRGALRLRFSDNHDERRAIARFGEPAALAASALMFSLDGVPLLYNGMEVGDATESGAPALFERLPIFWPIAARRPQFEPFYRALSELRRTHPVLRGGELRWVPNSDAARVLSFMRSDDSETLLIMLNLSTQPFAGTIAAGNAAFEDVTPAALRTGAIAQPGSALPAVSLGAWEFRIFQRRR